MRRSRPVAMALVLVATMGIAGCASDDIDQWEEWLDAPTGFVLDTVRIKANGPVPQARLYEDHTVVLKDYPVGALGVREDGGPCMHQTGTVSGSGTWELTGAVDAVFSVNGEIGYLWTSWRFSEVTWYSSGIARCDGQPNLWFLRFPLE